MLDLHVPAEVSLQVELTGAVRTLEGLAASVEVHVAQQVVHSVERLATYLEIHEKSGIKDIYRHHTHLRMSKQPTGSPPSPPK